MKTTFSDHCKPNLHFFAEFKPYHTPTANIRTWWRSNKLHRQIWRTKMSYFSFSLIIPLYNHPSLFIVRHMLYTLNLAALCTRALRECSEELFIYLLIYLYVTSLSTVFLNLLWLVPFFSRFVVITSSVSKAGRVNFQSLQCYVDNLFPFLDNLFSVRMT